MRGHRGDHPRPRDALAAARRVGHRRIRCGIPTAANAYLDHRLLVLLGKLARREQVALLVSDPLHDAQPALVPREGVVAVLDEEFTQSELRAERGLERKLQPVGNEAEAGLLQSLCTLGILVHLAHDFVQALAFAGRLRGPILDLDPGVLQIGDRLLAELQRIDLPIEPRRLRLELARPLEQAIYWRIVGPSPMTARDNANVGVVWQVWSLSSGGLRNIVSAE